MSTNRNLIIGIAFGIVAAIAYATSSVLIRESLAGMTPPLVGAAVALLSGTLALLPFRIQDLKASLNHNRKSVGFLLISGVVASLGIVSSFFALTMAPVVTVSPLQSTSPLFAMLWSYLFLRRLERITPKLVSGIILVVSGIILISIGRAI